jgi:UDP-galactopyranose mutase
MRLDYLRLLEAGQATGLARPLAVPARDGLRIHRISEFKNFSPHCAPPDKTIVCAEITCRTKLPHAYPVYDLEYRQNLTPVLDFVHTLNNVSTGGRQGCSATTT